MAGEGEKQFVRALPAFLGPDIHGEGGDEEQQEDGKECIKLIEVGQVVHEESGLPESRYRPQQDEYGDKDVSRGIDEVGKKIPFEHRLDHACVGGLVQRPLSFRIAIGERALRSGRSQLAKLLIE